MGQPENNIRERVDRKVLYDVMERKMIEKKLIERMKFMRKRNHSVQKNIRLVLDLLDKERSKTRLYFQSARVLDFDSRYERKDKEKAGERYSSKREKVSVANIDDLVSFVKSEEEMKEITKRVKKSGKKKVQLNRTIENDLKREKTEEESENRNEKES